MEARRILDRAPGSARDVLHAGARETAARQAGQVGEPLVVAMRHEAHRVRILGADERVVDVAPDLEPARADRGPDPRDDIVRVDVHRAKRRLEHARRQSAPARVRGGDDAASPIGEQDGQAVGRAHRDRDAGRRVNAASAWGGCASASARLCASIATTCVPWTWRSWHGVAPVQRREPRALVVLAVAGRRDRDDASPAPSSRERSRSSQAQGVDQRREIGRHGRDEPPRLARRRIGEAELLGVQRLARERGHARRGLARAVDRIADERVADRRGSVVATAHAGWRGLAAGVLEATMRRVDVDPHDVVAWIGPAIGPRRFEVGRDVYDAFVGAEDADAVCFVPHRDDKWLADLPGLARRRLARAGVHDVAGGTWCTVEDAARFHSWRRDKGHGRMLTAIAIAG